jgi:hypothetical protein
VMARLELIRTQLRRAGEGKPDETA